MLNSSNSTNDELEGLLNTANASIIQWQQTAEDNRADLSGVNLYNADLSGADLSGANLDNAYLSGADLSYADLSGANLDNAYLNGADLINADLDNAYLNGADLTYVYWENTICPDGTNSDNNGDTCVNNL
jgi:uncharacterized protein YjbI with pentapeptide repeats